MVKVLKNEDNLKVGNLYDKKDIREGILLKEKVVLEFNENEVDFSQILINAKREYEYKKNKIIIYEDKTFWVSADAFLQGIVSQTKNEEEIKKGIKYALIDKDKNKVRELKFQLKNIKRIIKQSKKLFKKAEQISKKEFDERKKKVKK